MLARRHSILDDPNKDDGEPDRPFTYILWDYLPEGYSPDGDTIHVRPVKESYLLRVHPKDKVQQRLEKSRDRSVSARSDLIDTPESHFGPNYSQPLADWCTDEALRAYGFDPKSAVWEQYRGMQMCKSINPHIIHGAGCARTADSHGRVVSLYLKEKPSDDELRKDHGWIEPDDVPVKGTHNYDFLIQGIAHPMLYTSSPKSHRLIAREAAAEARAKKLGVWAQDQTKSFILDGFDSIGPNGSLIYPKLFRRCIDYLKAVEKGGYTGSLVQWLIDSQTKPYHSGSLDDSKPAVIDRDDPVIVKGQKVVRLSDLLTHKGDRVTFDKNVDLLDLVFIEK